MNYANLIQNITENIKTNGSQAITAQVLQDVLVDMVGELGQSGALLGGVIDTSFVPDLTNDAQVVYIAESPGTYTNFNGLVVGAGEVAFFYFNGNAWAKSSVDVLEVVNNLNSTATDKALSAAMGKQIGDNISQLGQNVTELQAKTQDTIVHNKNLSDSAIGVDGFIDSGGSFNAMSTGEKSVKFPCQPSTTYTISKIVSSRFRVAYYNTDPASGTPGGGTITSNNSTAITITTAADSAYIVAFVYNGSSEAVTFDQIMESLQIEIGNEATSYVAPGYIVQVEADAVPTAGSEKLVKSGGVAQSLPSVPISNNYLINKYVKALWIQPNVTLTNVRKISIYYSSSRPDLIVRLKDSSSTVLYEFSNAPSAPGTFVDIDGGYVMLRTSSNQYLFAQIDFTAIDELSAAEMDVVFNTQLVGNILYSPVMLQWASSYGGAKFEVIEFEIQESSKKISEAGEIVSANSNWCYTKPIHFNKGDMVYVNTDGNANTSVMSKYDNGDYTNIISYDSNAGNSYYYIFKESMDVAFSLFRATYCCIFRYQNNLSTQLVGSGIQGESAYQCWLDLGNTGTEQDFIDSLQGAPGERGPRGYQGEQGNSGYTGAAGELEVVNNTTDGGATSALSAEAGKRLGELTDYNAIPVIPCVKNPKPLSFASINSSDWTSDQEGEIVSNNEVYDFVHREYVKSVTTKILTSAGTNSNKIYTTLSNTVDLTGKCVRFSLLIDENVDLTKLSQIKLILGSGGIESSKRCTSVIWTKGEDSDHTFGGIVAGCLNPVLFKESSGNSFDATSVDTVGFQMIYTTPVIADIRIDVIQLDIVDGLSKPGVVLVVDNFEPSVVDMAEYAATKGVRLNLSVIPNWIGGSSASLEDIQSVKRLGHLIFNHTWNHNTGAETYAETSEGIFKADNWMIRNGMARGSKFLSNPSAFYNNIRYKAQMDSEALVVYHNWTPYPNGETGNGKYLITFPFYPAERFLNIGGLDWNNFTSDRLNYFKSLAQSAMTNKGIAVIGFHDAAWDIDNGVSWKAFIDYVAEIQDIYFYGIDEIVEGLYC